MQQQISTEQLIRERAYAIWEQEGYPAGRDLEHWIAAEREIQADEGFARVKARVKSAKARGAETAALSRKAPPVPAVRAAGTPSSKSASLNAGKKLPPQGRDKHAPSRG